MLYRYKILYEIYLNYISRFPISYIYKCKNFYSYNFTCVFPILIFRFETEKIIDLFLNFFSSFFCYFILELGFGTGVISGSLNFLYLRVQIFAVDFNIFCLKLVKISVRKKKYIELAFFLCNFKIFCFNRQLFNCIIANPPYVSFYDIDFINDFESESALVSDIFGYCDLYKIIQLAYDILNVNGVLLLEHSYNQAKLVRYTMYKSGFINVCTYNDYNMLERFTCCEK